MKWPWGSLGCILFAAPANWLTLGLTSSRIDWYWWVTLALALATTILPAISMTGYWKEAKRWRESYEEERGRIGLWERKA
jgi:Na+/proline symporter